MEELFYLRWSGKASRAQPSNGGGRGSQADIRGQRTSRCKGPEVGTCLSYLKSQKPVWLGGPDWKVGRKRSEK